LVTAALDLATAQFYDVKAAALKVFSLNGIELKPIRLRKSLYLLVPMEVAKLIGITDKSKFVLTLKQNDECVLMYHKADTSHG